MSMYDDGEKAQYRRATKEEKKHKLMLDSAVEALLQHENGRAYLYWLLGIGKAIGQNPFTTNALSTAFECGEQNVGQQIMAHIIEVDPDGFLRVLKEQGHAGREPVADATGDDDAG